MPERFYNFPVSNRIVTSAPTRIDLAGGTIDIWPLYLFHDGASTVNILRRGTNPLTLILTLDLAPDADRITGTVSDGTWTADLAASAIGTRRRRPEAGRRARTGA